MTTLNKPIARRTELDPKLGRHEAGPVTVTLWPDNTISFRKLKRRREVRLTLDAVYSMALKIEARAIMEEKRKLRKQRRAAK
jgi:hypothetical protein